MKNNFISIVKTILFTLILSPLYATVAYSYSTQDVVVDSNGNKVLSGSDCLRTSWDVGKDKCIAEEEAKSEVKVVRKVIGMEEGTFYFDFDSAKLSEQEKARLDSLSATLKEHNVKAIKILGFTDRIGSDEYNHKLSKRRADAVKNYLDSKVTLDSRIVIERALGKQHQVKACKGKKGKELIECLRPNRRVVVEIDYLDKY